MQGPSLVLEGTPGGWPRRLLERRSVLEPVAILFLDV